MPLSSKMECNGSREQSIDKGSASAESVEVEVESVVEVEVVVVAIMEEGGREA